MTRDIELNRILILAAQSLDISQTLHEDATSKYQAVGQWLAEPKSELHRYNPVIYPQGSLALGTIVKPLGRDEFDIDLTCVLQVPPGITPQQLKEIVGNRLLAHETYKGMLEHKNRCWRLNYANEFHLDIIPAKPNPDQPFTTALKISDKEQRCWKDTNPKGYIKWFELRKAVSKAMMASGARAHVEPAPEQEDASEKAPLQIAVQLFKRHRDVTFIDREDGPISIIITTLAGKAYQQQQDVISTLRHLVKEMPNHIEYDAARNAYVRNPTNLNENFADKWRTHPDRKSAFYEWTAKLDRDLEALTTASGMAAVRRALDSFLGEKRSKIVLERYASDTTQNRFSSLKVDTRTGLIGATTGAAVGTNTFFGC
jgi:hypothetical protein